MGDGHRLAMKYKSRSEMAMGTVTAMPVSSWSRGSRLVNFSASARMLLESGAQGLRAAGRLGDFRRDSLGGIAGHAIEHVVQQPLPPGGQLRLQLRIRFHLLDGGGDGMSQIAIFSRDRHRRAVV